MDQDKSSRRPPRTPAPNPGTPATYDPAPGTIRVRVIDFGTEANPIRGALVSLATYAQDGPLLGGVTGDDGRIEITAPPGNYSLSVEALGFTSREPEVTITSACHAEREVRLGVNLTIHRTVTNRDCQPVECEEPMAGGTIRLEASHDLPSSPVELGYRWSSNFPFVESEAERQQSSVVHLDTGSRSGKAQVSVTLFTLSAPTAGSAARLGGPAITADGVPFGASSPAAPGAFNTLAGAGAPSGPSVTTTSGFLIRALPPQPITGSLSVGLRRTASTITRDLGLWLVIKASTDALSYRSYEQFMNSVLLGMPLPTASSGRSAALRSKEPELLRSFKELQQRRYLPFTDTDAYRLLKVATEAFLTVNGGVFVGTATFDDAAIRELEQGASIDTLDAAAVWANYLTEVNGTNDLTLPYLGHIASKFPELALKNPLFRPIDSAFNPLLTSKLTEPFLIELIWSYWHEEGMLVQTMNAISARFQNRRGVDRNDPLANMELDPLRPLNNLLWGYIQDEQHRLTVLRRAYEYDHHYGLQLRGRAVPAMRTADSRSQFLQAFHNLLHKAALFFQQDDDTTVISDGFPVLNALKEVHLILSQGAHNQFGDLPFTARAEMLMQQWLLARPEFREVLPTRVMVAYPEPWMDRVDAMKKVQGWSDVNILHFRDLAVFGEKLLLSIRFGDWVDANVHDQAKNWARIWRSEIAGYIHAYRAVTGVDVSVEPVNAAQPSQLLRERLTQQRRRA